MLALLTASSGLTGLGQALRVGQVRAPPSRPASIQEMNRRHVLLAGAAALPLMGSPLSAVASGGATARQTTSIPRAKLRYYDRITAAVAEFESLNGALGEAGALKKAYGSFFSEVDGSAWMELKGAGFLLAGASQMGSRTLFASSPPATLLSTDREARTLRPAVAFKIDTKIPPDKIQQVKDYKKLIKDLEALKAAGKPDSAKAAYAKAKASMDVYLDGVELPPLGDQRYAAAS